MQVQYADTDVNWKQAGSLRECYDSTCEDPVYLYTDHLGSVSLATPELPSNVRG